jgi:hypothetical protein
MATLATMWLTTDAVQSTVLRLEALACVLRQGSGAARITVGLRNGRG